MSPLYEYVCPECGATREHLEPYDKRRSAPSFRWGV